VIKDAKNLGLTRLPSYYLAKPETPPKTAITIDQAPTGPRT
jgi:hypothetical protein